MVSLYTCVSKVVVMTASELASDDASLDLGQRVRLLERTALRAGTAPKGKRLYAQRARVMPDVAYMYMRARRM
jgi:hypothetical protein